MTRSRHVKLLPEATAEETAAVAAADGVLLRIAGELVREVEETEDCDGEEWLVVDAEGGGIFFLMADDDDECLCESNLCCECFCFPGEV